VASDLDDVLAMSLGGGLSEGGDAASALDIHALQRLIGGYQWVERRVFEVLGSWVGNEVLPEARILLDAQSQQHGWHAELFAERMPVIDSVDPAAYVLPPSAEADRLLSMLGGGQSGGTLLRLVSLARVLLPRLVAGYALHLRRTAPVADAALSRALRLVLRDDLEAWQASEAMVQALVRRPHDVAVVTAHQQALEEQVAETGPGIVPWPTAAGLPDP
jgi:hypothetical protein